MSWAESALISMFWPIMIIAIIIIARSRRKKAKGNEQTNRLGHASPPIQQPISSTPSINRQVPLCPSCGAQLKEGTRFCSICGQAVSVVGQSVPMVQHFNQTVPTMEMTSDVYIKGNRLSKGQRILNLASEATLIDTFQYSRGIISIKTQDGSSFQAPLNQMSVRFRYWPNTKQRTASLEYQGGKISIVDVPASIIKANFDTIIGILSQAGTTYNAESVTEENMAVADQMVSFQRGYRMANAMKRW